MSEPNLWLSDGGMVVLAGTLVGAGGNPSLANVLAAGNDANGSQIVDLADPTSAQDAATKAYVDASVGPPSGPAGGDLAGTYPDPTIGTGKAAANVGTLGGVLGGTLPNPSLAAGAAATNVGTLGGDLTGTLPNPSLAAIITPATKGDATHSAIVVCDANGRITSLTEVAIAAPPAGSAGGDLTGTYPSPTLAAFGPGVTTVGSTSVIPVVTTDAAGRISALTSATPQIDTIGAGTNITTNDVSITKHGLCPKLPNDATKYLDGTGAYTVPAGGGGGAVVLLTTVTLAADGTFDVTSISQSYAELRGRLIVRGTRSNAGENLVLRVNNDSGSNYAYETVSGLGTTAAAAETTGGTSFVTGITAASAPANSFAVVEFQFLNYTSTSQHKDLLMRSSRRFGTGSANNNIENVGGTWLSTAAINRVTILGSFTANLLAGSVLSLYGIAA